MHELQGVLIAVRLAALADCGSMLLFSKTHLDDVLGSSGSAEATDASSMLSRSGESEMRRSCIQYPTGTVSIGCLTYKGVSILIAKTVICSPAC